LTRQVLIDAVAVGQITPGPVLSTATFIGWQMNGIIGAILNAVNVAAVALILVVCIEMGKDSLTD